MNENKTVEIPIDIPIDISYLEVIFLKLLQEERYEEAANLPDILDYLPYLEEHGYIKMLGDDIKDIDLRESSLQMFQQIKSTEAVSLAEEMRNLFPIGIKSGGYPVRGNLRDIEEKLKAFFKKYNYSKKTVLEATRRYIREKEDSGFSYIQIITYFISKNNVSQLASYCEMIENGEERSSNNEDFTVMIN